MRFCWHFPGFSSLHTSSSPWWYEDIYTHMCYAALNNDKNDKLWRSRRIGIKASCQAHVIFKDYLIESLIIKSFLEFAMRCHISLYHFSTWWRLPILKLMYPFLNFTMIFKHLNKQSGRYLKINKKKSHLNFGISH